MTDTQPAYYDDPTRYAQLVAYTQRRANTHGYAYAIIEFPDRSLLPLATNMQREPRYAAYPVRETVHPQHSAAELDAIDIEDLA